MQLEKVCMAWFTASNLSVIKQWWNSCNKPGPPCFARSTILVIYPSHLTYFALNRFRHAKMIASLSVAQHIEIWGRSLSLFENTALHNTDPIVDTKILALALWVPFLTTATKQLLAFLRGILWLLPMQMDTCSFQASLFQVTHLVLHKHTTAYRRV